MGSDVLIKISMNTYHGGWNNSGIAHLNPSSQYLPIVLTINSFILLNSGLVKIGLDFR